MSLGQIIREKYTADFEQGLVSGPKGLSVGSQRPDGYWHIAVYACGRRHNVSRARMIWFLSNGNWPEQIDHINRIRSDDRLINLRDVTQRVNHQNKSNHGELPIGVRHVQGVVSKPYSAGLQVNRRWQYLGTYATSEEASKAYQDACNKQGV